MLEETNTKTKELVTEVHGNLDIGALHDTLCDFRTLMDNPIVKEAQFDDDAEAGLFRTYHVLVHFTHYGVDTKAVGELISMCVCVCVCGCSVCGWVVWALKPWVS